MHKAFSGAAFWVAVFEVPAGGLKGRATVGGDIVSGSTVGGVCGVVVVAAISRAETVFLVADHVDKAISC